MCTTTYYLVRWTNPRSGKVQTSTQLEQPTLEQAKEQLAADVGYFYDDIEITLSKVTELVIETVHGSNRRPGNKTKAVGL